ncbi:MAG TPA: hypothetical protein VF175_04235 [Lacipirellula sp.]
MQRFTFFTALALSAGLALGCADSGNDAATTGDAETGAEPADTATDGATVEEGGVAEPPADPAVEEEPATELPDAAATE